MSRKHKKTQQKPQPPKRQNVALEELEAIVERSRAALPADDHATLSAAIATLASLTQELESKQTSLDRLRRLIFGAATEKTDAVLGESGDAAGSETPVGDATLPSQRQNKPRNKRKGHGRHGAADYPRAPRVAVAHDRLACGDPCPIAECVGGRVYLQRKAPAVLVRITGVAPLRPTVYELERLRCHLCGTVFTATPPEGVGEKKYDEGAAAMIALMKYGCGMPFYRLQRLERCLAIPLPASTQWEVVREAAAAVAPAFDELLRQAAAGDVLHNDDTGARILSLTEEARGEALPDDADPERSGVFTSGVVSICEGHRVALFMTGPRHAGENLARVLDERDPDAPPPIQMADALSRNAPGEHKTETANCLAHARRKYVDVAAHFPQECRFVLETLRKVFIADRRTRERGMSPARRLALHQRYSAPVMAKLEEWMTEQIKARRVEPNSGLGKAIAYMQKHWQALTAFLRVPGAPLDNNICERALKKSIINRKNSMFFKTLNGAQVADVFMSLIHTAELCEVEPFDYLLALQRHREAVLLDPPAWMPWNYTEALAALAPDTS